MQWRHGRFVGDPAYQLNHMRFLVKDSAAYHLSPPTEKVS
jgi:hypothetical protein